MVTNSPPGHINRPDHAALEGLPSICFDRWRFSIQTAMDLDQLMLVVSAYLSVWTLEQLSMLPPELSDSHLHGSDDLIARAVLARRAEVNCSRDTKRYPFLREISLTFAAAASRFRYLQAIRAGRR